VFLLPNNIDDQSWLVLPAALTILWTETQDIYQNSELEMGSYAHMQRNKDPW